MNVLGLLVIYGVGTVVGFLWGAWYCRKMLYRAEATYRAAKAVAIVAEMALAALEAELGKPEEKK